MPGPRPTTCEHCGGPLPAPRGTRPARFCSATCRSRAHRDRVKADRPALAAVPDAGPAVVAAPPAPAVVQLVPPPSPPEALDHVAELRAHLVRLDALMNICPAEKAASLAKEYRETLRELAALDAAAQAEAEVKEKDERRAARRLDLSAI